MNGQTLTINEATALVARALEASNTSAPNAASVARALIAAEVDGQTGHGLSRVASYAAQSRSGKVDGHATPTSTSAGPALRRVDAAFGFAYPALDMAMDLAEEVASECGVGFVAITNSHHFGQAGAHCEVLANRGFAAFTFGNSPSAIAPHGGRRPLLGTNPVAFAAPRNDAPPLVIDLAVSVAARGKILAAEKSGDSIPEGWALDADGRPTTDPKAALKGSMVPIGGAKGAALALIVEIMGTAVAGAHLAFEASSLFTPDGPPPAIGQTVLAIDVRRASAGAFDERLETLVSEIEADEGVRLPGSRRLANRIAAERDGIAVPDHLFKEIGALADGG